MGRGGKHGAEVCLCLTLTRRKGVSTQATGQARHTPTLNAAHSHTCKNILKNIHTRRLLMQHTVRDSTSPAPGVLQNELVENVVVAPGHR